MKRFFFNLEEKSKAYFSKLEKIYGRKYNYEDVDPGDVYEQMREETFEYYEMEVLMEHNLTLSLISTLFQVFEQQLRSLLYQELNHTHSMVKTKSKLNKFGTNMGEIQEIFKLLDYDLKDSPYWNDINELNKLNNAFKHGQGNSFDKLIKLNPKLINTNELEGVYTTNNEVIFDLNEVKFDKYSNAIINFWKEFPEHLTNYVDINQRNKK